VERHCAASLFQAGFFTKETRDGRWYDPVVAIP
jgi:hypothetical protein